MSELRGLTRYRKALINEKAPHVNRIHKVLQDSGIKLTTYATDVMGASGRAMNRALIAGQSDSAALAKGRMRTKLHHRAPHGRRMTISPNITSSYF